MELALALRLKKIDLIENRDTVVSYLPVRTLRLIKVIRYIEELMLKMKNLKIVHMQVWIEKMQKDIWVGPVLMI
jgi:hypothetical protein